MIGNNKMQLQQKKDSAKFNFSKFLTKASDLAVRIGSKTDRNKF